MKRFSAQYIITNSGPPLKRGIITAEDDGTILSVEDTGGNPEEKHSVEFHNGIIIPGFVNCHCHLEFSHMKGEISPGGGLGSFIQQIRSTKNNSSENITKSASAEDRQMYLDGTVLCADICNTSLTFEIKKESRIKYVNLLEVFGTDPQKAEKRLGEITKVAEAAAKMNLPFSLVPHAFYSMSLALLRILREKSRNNKVTSVHFMETPGEKEFLENFSGPLLTSFLQTGILPSRQDIVKNHTEAVINEVTRSGNLILVHNTFADRETIREANERENIFWCLCPASNIYIENEIPPVNLFIEEGCEIVIGTDSLASNNSLSILEELKTLQFNFPSLTFTDLIGWATVNGAKALGEEERFGKIETGKKPGLLLIQNVDLQNMKLLSESFVTRLI
jgi:cytosine/adenosine deaminase-related metal-dependent hydrolase